MNLSKTTYYNLASLLPAKLIRKITPVSTLFPYHHTVSDEDLPHIKHLYSYKNIAQFRTDLDTLLKSYKPVSADEINTALVAGRKLPQNSFLLSFDDGFREVYDVVAPILIEKGVPAIFFLNPAFLDNHELFYRCKVSLIIDELLKRENEPWVLKNCAAVFQLKASFSIKELLTTIKQINNLNQHLLNELARELQISFNDYLQKRKPFLTTNQVKELAEKGFSIGAHSWDHPYYNLLSIEEQIQQTTDSCLYVQERFFDPLSLFSFPFSDKNISQDFFDQMDKSAGPINIYFGTQNNKEEIFNKVIHRFNAERPSVTLSKQINGLLLMLAFQRLKNNHIANRMKIN